VKSHVGDLAESDIEHELLLICKDPVSKRALVVDQLEDLVQLNCLWDEEDLVGVMKTLDDALLVDVHCRVYSRFVSAVDVLIFSQCFEE